MASKDYKMPMMYKLIDFIKEESLKKFIYKWKPFVDFLQEMDKNQICLMDLMIVKIQTGEKY